MKSRLVTVEAATGTRMLLQEELPKTTLPLPLSTWLPLNTNEPMLPLLGWPTRATPFITSPLTTLRLPLSRSRLPFTVTPSNIPATPTSAAPSLVLTTNWRNVPPFTFQLPVVALSSKVPPPPFSVPVTCTVPPLRVIVPRSPSPQVPSRLKTELLNCNSPALNQSPRKISVPALIGRARLLV